MATKTISIDLEAYDRLRSARRQKEESFSQVIKRVIRKPADVDALLRNLDRLSDRSVAAIEEHVSRRHQPSKRRR